MNYQSIFLISLLTSYVSLSAEQPTKMIVFIHGTIKPVEFTFTNLLKLMKNKIDNTVYVHTAAEIRKDPMFFQGQAMQYLGLQRITEKSPSPGAICLTHLFDKQFDYFEKEKTTRLYYTFGWDGLMNIRKRYEASEKLYQALEKELKKLHAQGITPTIDLYCYSYGGAVGLNLGAVRDDNPDLNPHAFTIDNLILFGVPIQKATDYLVSSPIFKKVYNFYSKEDSIQVMDIFSSREFFMDRRFSHRSQFKIPEKVKQIRLRFTKKIYGEDKIKNTFKDPFQLMASTKLRKKHIDPGHSELWNFKEGSYWYRDYFSLEPLPVVALAPSFIHALDTYAPERRHITLDYNRKYYVALLTSHSKHLRKVVPILTPQLTEELYTITDKYKPKNFSVEEQHERTQSILKKIKKSIKKNNPYRKSRLLMTHLKFNRLPQLKKI